VVGSKRTEESGLRQKNCSRESTTKQGFGKRGKNTHRFLLANQRGPSNLGFPSVRVETARDKNNDQQTSVDNTINRGKVRTRKRLPYPRKAAGAGLNVIIGGEIKSATHDRSLRSEHKIEQNRRGKKEVVAKES